MKSLLVSLFFALFASTSFAQDIIFPGGEGSMLGAGMTVDIEVNGDTVRVFGEITNPAGKFLTIEALKFDNAGAFNSFGSEVFPVSQGKFDVTLEVKPGASMISILLDANDSGVGEPLDYHVIFI